MNNRTLTHGHAHANLSQVAHASVVLAVARDSHAREGVGDLPVVVNDCAPAVAAMPTMSST